MRIINQIPKYKPVVHLLKGQVERNNGILYVGGLEVPKNFHGKLRRRSRGKDSLQQAIDEKQIYLRGASNGSESVNWFGLVTDKFTDLPIAELGQAFADVNSDAIIRYDTRRERFVVSYGIGRFPESTHLFLDSGDFGTYGGNGEMTVRTGVALYGTSGNRIGVVLSDSIRKRFIHRWDHNDISDVVNEVREFGEEVSKEFEAPYIMSGKEVVNYTRQLSLL
ncbi:hypothetical protein J4216_06070 [Candidatus Woesearchaeota archaeon]|nr:hypothetical protein [Candidatus Woesearchaeota archaeon]